MNPAQETPQVKCRCCAGLMDAIFQPSIVKGKPGYFMLTCGNEGCDLLGYTFSINLYHEIDLTPYMCKARA